MKKSFITTVVLMASLLVFTGGTVFAQNQQVALPSAGLTPESPFYFFDKFGEAMRSFFTFNPEGKAHLQITFASERVAEIKIILETKGVEAKGLEVAKSRLQAHLANAASIVVDQKAEGKDVSSLAKELDDEFESPKSALEQTFKEQEQAKSLVQQLGQVKAQKELLELKEEEVEDALEREEERIEEEIEAREEAEEAIREAEKEKQEVLDEAAEEGLIAPAEAFGKFDGLLAQAKSALAAGNFQEAKRLAKQAEKILDGVEEAIEDLEEAKEKEEELKEEQEEKEREAKEEQDEKLKEDAEKEADRLEKEKENAEEESRKAEERLREAGNNEEGD
mgnify:CR=1 FL=1